MEFSGIVEEDLDTIVIRISQRELEEIKHSTEYVMTDGHDGSVLVKLNEDAVALLEHFK